MKWNLETRHQILLEITNALISKNIQPGFFFSIDKGFEKTFSL